MGKHIQSHDVSFPGTIFRNLTPKLYEDLIYSRGDHNASRLRQWCHSCKVASKKKEI